MILVYVLCNPRTVPQRRELDDAGFIFAQARVVLAKESLRRVKHLHSFFLDFAWYLSQPFPWVVHFSHGCAGQDSQVTVVA